MYEEGREGKRGVLRISIINCCLRFKSRVDNATWTVRLRGRLWLAIGVRG
jgi:hypothetical protein